MKRLLIPILILIVVVIAWVLVSRHEQARISGNITENFLDLDCDRIDRFVTSSAARELEVINLGGQWFINEDPPRLADQIIVDRVIQHACTLSVGEVFSSNPDMQDEFMITDQGGTEVSFYDGDNLLSSVIVGKLGPEMSHTYLRRKNSDNVYIVPPFFNYAFNMTRAQLADKTLIRCPLDSVASVTIQTPERAYTLKPREESDDKESQFKWMVTTNPSDQKGQQARPSVVSAFLREACALRGIDLVGPKDSGLVDFDPPAMTLILRRLDGETSTVELAQEPPGANPARYYARIPDSRDTIVITNYSYTNLLNDYSDYLYRP